MVADYHQVRAELPPVFRRFVLHRAVNYIGEILSHREVIHMDAGLVEPCPNSDVVFNDVHEWMTVKALRRRSRIIPGGRLDVVDQIARDRCLPTREVSDALEALKDQGWVESFGEGKGFLVLIPLGKNFQELSANASAAGPERGTLTGANPEGRRALPSETSEARRATPRPPPGMEESAQSYGPDAKYPQSKRVVLARIFFPNLCREHGIVILPGGMDWRPLARALRDWEQDYGIDVDMARRMMEEFVRHSEWCQTRTFPWRVFVSRRDKLVDLVNTRRRRDPANRRHSGGAEYWLGRR